MTRSLRTWIIVDTFLTILILTTVVYMTRPEWFRFSSRQNTQEIQLNAQSTQLKNRVELKPNQQAEYRLKQVETGEWSINGLWKLTDESAQALSSTSVFRMKFKSDAMHLVLGSMDGPRDVRVTIDGRDPRPEELTVDTRVDQEGFALLRVNEKRLYRVGRFPDGGEHTIELLPVNPGIEFYAATFGAEK